MFLDKKTEEKGLRGKKFFGFTLVEIMVSLAIISILLAVTAPVITKKFGKRHVAAAGHQWVLDNGALYPDSDKSVLLAGTGFSDELTNAGVNLFLYGSSTSANASNLLTLANNTLNSSLTLGKTDGVIDPTDENKGLVFNFKQGDDTTLSIKHPYYETLKYDYLFESNSDNFQYNFDDTFLIHTDSDNEGLLLAGNSGTPNSVSGVHIVSGLNVDGKELNGVSLGSTLSSNSSVIISQVVGSSFAANSVVLGGSNTGDASNTLVTIVGNNNIIDDSSGSELLTCSTLTPANACLCIESFKDQIHPADSTMTVAQYCACQDESAFEEYKGYLTDVGSKTFGVYCNGEPDCSTLTADNACDCVAEHANDLYPGSDETVLKTCACANEDDFDTYSSYLPAGATYASYCDAGIDCSTATLTEETACACVDKFGDQKYPNSGFTVKEKCSCFAFSEKNGGEEGIVSKYNSLSYSNEKIEIFKSSCWCGIHDFKYLNTTECYRYACVYLGGYNTGDVSHEYYCTPGGNGGGYDDDNYDDNNYYDNTTTSTSNGGGAGAGSASGSDAGRCNVGMVYCSCDELGGECTSECIPDMGTDGANESACTAHCQECAVSGAGCGSGPDAIVEVNGMCTPMSTGDGVYEDWDSDACLYAETASDCGATDGCNWIDFSQYQFMSNIHFEPTSTSTHQFLGFNPTPLTTAVYAATSDLEAALDKKQTVVIGSGNNLRNTHARFVIGNSITINDSDLSVVVSTKSSSANILGDLDVKHVYGSVSTTPSDIRLKNIIAEYKESLDKVKLLKPYLFKFKDDGTQKVHAGVIAQDLQKIFPSAVSKMENGYLAITRNEMFYAVMNSIKEINNKVVTYISEVNKSIKALEARVDANKAKVAEIKKQEKAQKQEIKKLNKQIKKLERELAKLNKENK